MSKRRVSKQQTLRIKKRLDAFHQSNNEPGNTLDGLVITRFGSHALIESNEGTLHHCSIRPSIESLVAGDRVVWVPEGEENQGVVVSLYPRQSMLGRPSNRGKIKPVAANISQMMIVIAPKPEVSWALLDSYLVVSETLALKPCIVLNKTDLPKKAIEAQLENIYKPLGYDILYTSKTAHHPELIAQLTSETTVFVGQSGVGKSSLIASVLPEREIIDIGALSKSSELGKHTTSNSTFYHLPTGGAIIDSPGVREFGLWHMPKSEIAKGFVEFHPYLSQCKYRDCDHESPPGCALKKAVLDHKISAERLENYVKISTKFSK